MAISPPNKSLSELASTLSKWVADERIGALCAEWSAYWAGERPEKPEGKIGLGVPRKDSDFQAFSDAFFCVKMGLASRSEFHAERVFRKMRTGPVLDKFPTQPVFNVPQARDGKM